MSGVPYVELHCHSAYSFLDGASLPEELVLAAARQGHDALALTDHDGVSGSMEFAHAAAAAGLRALHGAEVTIRIDPKGPPLPPADMEPDPATRRHLTLLVKNGHGWANLCRLLTKAHQHTRDHPRRVRTAPWVTIGDVCDAHQGLICLSGCADHGVEEESTLRMLRDVFGPEDLYVELQRRYLRGDREQGRRREQLARRLGLRCVATGNVHAHSKERALLQDALVAIRRHTTLDASEPVRRGNHSHVLATPRAMAARLDDHPEAVAETVRIAERLEFDLTRQLGYSYPGAEDAEAARALAGVCEVAFAERYPAGHRLRARAQVRLEEELALIGRLKLPGFFVLHHEILELARDVAFDVRGPSAARAVLPPGRGRGSSVSSIVCYLTGLSHVDPIETGLSLGRFLNDDVSGVPDIDLDFPRDIRAELIPRVHQRFGTDRAALVAAFPTYRARGAIREIGAALGLPAAELERVARASEGWSGHGVAGDIAMTLGPEGAHVGGPGGVPGVGGPEGPYPSTHPGDPGHPSRRDERAGVERELGDGGVSFATTDGFVAGMPPGWHPAYVAGGPLGGRGRRGIPGIPATPPAAPCRTRGASPGAECSTPATCPPGWSTTPTARPATAGSGWRSSRVSPTACRGTSRSTRAAWWSPPGRWWTAARWCPPRWPAGRWSCGTRTPAPTPASSRSTCSAWGCSRASSAASS